MGFRQVIRWGSAAGLAFGTAACVPSQQSSTDESAARQNEASMQNELTEAERTAGWRLLFDGRSLDGWRAYQSRAQPSNWRVTGGVLTKSHATDDILSVDQFDDFELAFDWKLSPGGNAGVFYRATEEYERVYWSATEYQLLDDSNHRDGQNRLTSAGAAYGLYPAPAGAAKAAGAWNSARIVVKGAHVEHWLNGIKLLEYEYGSPEWVAKVEASKFVEWPNYGRATRGHIAIQGDHEGELSLRNIRIREL